MTASKLFPAAVVLAVVALSACSNTQRTTTTHTKRGITETRTVSVQYPNDVRSNRERVRDNTLPESHGLR